MLLNSCLVIPLIVMCAGPCFASKSAAAETHQECRSFGVSESAPVPTRAESLLQLVHLRTLATESIGDTKATKVYDDVLDPSCEVGRHCAAGMPEQRGACVHPGFGDTPTECWDICNEGHSPEDYLTGDPEFDELFADAVRQVRSGNYRHMTCDSLVDSKAKFDVSGTMQEVKKALEAAEEARLVTRAAAIEAKDLVNASKEKRTEAAEVMQEAATAEANALAEARKAMQAIQKLADQKAEQEAEELEEKKLRAEAKAEDAAAKLERTRELENAAKDAEEAAMNATLKEATDAEEAASNATMKEVNATKTDVEAEDTLQAEEDEGAAVAEIKARLKREEAQALEATRKEEEKAAEAAAAVEAAAKAAAAAKQGLENQVNGTLKGNSSEAKVKQAEAVKKNVEAKKASHTAKKALVAAKRTQADLEKAKLQGKIIEHKAVIERVSKLEADLEKAENVAVRLRAELDAEKEVERQLAGGVKEAEAAARLAEMQAAEAEVDEIAAEAAVEEAVKGAEEEVLIQPNLVNHTGATAPLNETGIQAVAALKSIAEMEVFVVRVVLKLKLKVINSTGLLLESEKLNNAEDLRKQNKSFAVLEEDINRTMFFPGSNAWIGSPILVDHPDGPDLNRWGRRVVKKREENSSGNSGGSDPIQACSWKAHEQCVQEFMYAGNPYEGCTTQDASEGMAWCSFDAFYDGRWANCAFTCVEGTSDGVLDSIHSKKPANHTVGH